jgi:5-methylcytosine-specific restriction endonuclease McrA
MFGSDDIFYHGIHADELAPYFSFGRGRQWDDLRGGIYCVSATMLQDVYSPFAGPWTPEHEVSYQRLRAEIETNARQTRKDVPNERFSEGTLQQLWVLERARFARLCTYLRYKAPVTVIGHSIFVYRLTDDEARVATRGTADEYVSLINATTGEPQGN